MGNSKSVGGLDRVFTNSNWYNLYHTMRAKCSTLSGFVVYVLNLAILLQFYFVKNKNNNNRLNYIVFKTI